MSDYNYWKDRYQPTWQQAQSKELAIIALIKQEVGLEVKPIGLGAGSAEYLSGSAAAQGYARGGADLEIVGTNIQLEVTGPLAKTVEASAPLWVRPDKIQNARSHYPEVETWIIHHLAKDNTLRVINLNEQFYKRLDARAFPIVNPFIRGTQETYLEIRANDPVVQPWIALIQRLKSL